MVQEACLPPAVLAYFIRTSFSSLVSGVYTVGHTWNPRAGMLSPSQQQGSGCRLGMQPVNWFLVMYGMTYSCDPSSSTIQCCKEAQLYPRLQTQPQLDEFWIFFSPLEFSNSSCCVNSYTAIESILSSC